jgi:ribosomal RNA-processing protein 1
LTDIFVDELEKLSPEHMKDQLPVEQLVEPFQILSVKSPTKMVRVKAKELLLDGRLANWGFEKAPEGEIKKKVAQTEPEGEDEDEEMEDEEWGGIDD